MARDLGAGSSIDIEGGGLNLSRGPGKAAVEFLKNNLEGQGGDKTLLLRQIATLEEHEDLVATLSNELKSNIALAENGTGEVVVVQYDFRSLLELHPMRGDSYDYYHYQKMNVLGMAAHVSGRKGPTFVDVISPDLRRDSEAAGAALAAGATYILDNLACRSKMKRLIYWADCGRHFRNRYIAYELLANNFVSIPIAELRFVGENHGKSVVDGHFNWIGTVVKNETTNWGNPPADIVNAVRNAAERAGGPNRTIPLYVDELELGHEPTLLDFQHVSAAHKICRQGDKYYVEDKQIPKKVVWVGGGGRVARPSKTKPKIGQIVDTVDNKFKKRRLLCSEGKAGL